MKGTVPMAKPATTSTGTAKSIAPVNGPAKDKSSTTMEQLHDVTHQVHLIREALQSEKRRLGFFLGAGCPLGIYDKEGKESLKHIPDVLGLTTAVGVALTGEANFKDHWIKLTAACKTDTVLIPNVEHILTQVRTICALKGIAQVDGMTAADLVLLDTKICESIATTVGKPLPSHSTSYHRFAAWISQIERVNPVELFTPNYDLLFEEALENYNVPFFDGFVGAREPFFDLAAMEQDAVPPRWTRLWKLHGSINWIKRADESVFRCHPVKKGQQLLIYPSHLKYDQSRRMPYLAMIDRLRAFFRDTNSVLVVCGYSFTDDHLNEVLLDGLRGNRSAHCFALMYSSLKDCEAVTSHASKNANLSVLAWDGAVIGTRPGSYKPVERSIIAPGVGFDAAKSKPEAAGDNLGAGQCRLGDFHHFSLFLESQFGVKVSNEQATDGR